MAKTFGVLEFIECELKIATSTKTVQNKKRKKNYQSFANKQLQVLQNNLKHIMQYINKYIHLHDVAKQYIATS